MLRGEGDVLYGTRKILLVKGLGINIRDCRLHTVSIFFSFFLSFFTTLKSIQNQTRLGARLASADPCSAWHTWCCDIYACPSPLASGLHTVVTVSKVML